MALKLGKDAKAYRNTGTWGTPVWDEVPNVKEVTSDISAGEADASSRASGGWESTLPTLKAATVEFQMNYDLGDADFTAIKNASLNGTVIDMWFLDGSSATSGNQGLRAEFSVIGFVRNEPLLEVMTVDVTLKASTVNGNNPEWKVVP